jgi:hypothetical protein
MWALRVKAYMHFGALVRKCHFDVQCPEFNF